MRYSDVLQVLQACSGVHVLQETKEGHNLLVSAIHWALPYNL